MVKTQTSISISIRKSDEDKFNKFVEIVQKDPYFQEEKEIISKENPKESRKKNVFIGLSRVFNIFWKLYLEDKGVKDD